MKRLIATILLTIAMLTSSATAQEAQRPLPKFVQQLTDSQYTVWAQWQNRQTQRRSAEVSSTLPDAKYNYDKQVERSGFSRGRVTSRQGHRANADRTALRTHGSVGSRRSRLVVTTGRTVRTLNPDYVGPGASVVYNPWARPEGGIGTPKWERIFVPVKEGTMTLQEILDRLNGPIDPEEVFTIFMQDYFSTESE